MFETAGEDVIVIVVASKQRIQKTLETAGEDNIVIVVASKQSA